ncbi:cell death activator CIDE-3-like [Hippocampus comes]|uniref:cell death activator CIDE-3-like n=1 Tax=Hippocampus comes TaxID=109280 RepID=UPI00094F23B1|nr:PREDICTED: cell death activator CIDE-3-like [Hippocampus comes]XP_019736118.1 PREDICTED: cell death activator CIDE-3-like [Hippocampus comes]XP_019736119.1 PREDICTED: cell death activator CIDE-3-like [Hippocampus comes]XP_019736120.1 PREDICTED: cell death activator CIDE-3-like [Hippocampus comes]
MDYARKSLNLLTLSSFSKCVTASMSASASMTQQLLSRRASRPKPFRVTNADRSLKKGVMADALEDLINKVGDSLNVLCASGLVLEEDGTGVDTEEFFTTLPDNTVLMVLEEGQKWTPPQSAPSRDELSNRMPQRRLDVAKLTFDLYKSHPSDFIGCLNVKATLYGVYSLSYEVRCSEAKKMLKEALRWTAFSMQATGHILLGSSWYMEQLLEEEEEEGSPEEGLPLHRESPMGRLQSFLLRRATYR